MYCVGFGGFFCGGGSGSGDSNNLIRVLFKLQYDYVYCNCSKHILVSKVFKVEIRFLLARVAKWSV